MTHKPMLRAEVYARALRASLNVKRTEVWVESAGLLLIARYHKTFTGLKLRGLQAALFGAAKRSKAAAIEL